MSAHTAAAGSSHTTQSVADRAKRAAQDSLSWAKALLAKIAKAVKGGWTAGIKFAKSFLAKYGSFAGIGAAAMMATKKGWHTMVKATRWVADTARKGVTRIIRGTGRILNWFGQKLGWLVGKVSTSTGAKIQGWSLGLAMHFGRAAERFDSFAARAIEKVYDSAKSGLVTKVVNIVSIAILGGLIGNMLLSGQVAAQLATLPTVGGFLASVVAGGPMTFAALGLVAVAGTVYARVFDWDDVLLEKTVEETDVIKNETAATQDAIKAIKGGKHAAQTA